MEECRWVLGERYNDYILVSSTTIIVGFAFLLECIFMYLGAMQGFEILRFHW